MITPETTIDSPERIIDEGHELHNDDYQAYRRAWQKAHGLGEPPRAAEMFPLRYIEELGNREIAAVMGTSQAVVAVTLSQTRSKLRA